MRWDDGRGGEKRKGERERERKTEGETGTVEFK